MIDCFFINKDNFKKLKYKDISISNFYDLKIKINLISKIFH